MRRIVGSGKLQLGCQNYGKDGRRVSIDGLASELPVGKAGFCSKWRILVDDGDGSDPYYSLFCEDHQSKRRGSAEALAKARQNRRSVVKS